MSRIAGGCMGAVEASHPAYSHRRAPIAIVLFDIKSYLTFQDFKSGLTLFPTSTKLTTERAYTRTV